MWLFLLLQFLKKKRLRGFFSGALTVTQGLEDQVLMSLFPRAEVRTYIHYGLLHTSDVLHDEKYRISNKNFMLFENTYRIYK